jgi:hypothetical protein
VIYSEKEGIIVDPFCPMGTTVSSTELKRRGKKVIELLNRIDMEAASNRKQIHQTVKPTKAQSS